MYTLLGWLVIVTCEAALAYAIVATLGRLTPRPGATHPAHSADEPS